MSNLCSFVYFMANLLFSKGGGHSVQCLFCTAYAVYTVCLKITPSVSNFSLPLHTTKYHAAKISPSGGDVAAGDRRGAFPMWRPCRGSPSRAKLVPGLHIKGLSNKSPDRCRRRGFTVLPPTGGIINSLPQSGNPQPSGQRPVKLKNPPAHRAGQS